MNRVNRMIFALLGVAALLSAQVRLRPAELRKVARTGKDATSQDSAEQWLSSPILGYVTYETPSVGARGSCAEQRVIGVLAELRCRERLEVRAILGVPEASYLSDALELPEFTSRITFAPGYVWAIVFRGEQAAALAWSPEKGTLGTFEGVITQPDLLAFSPSGTEAALYWRDTKRLIVYSVLPEGISVVQWGSSDLLPADLESLAISDGGASLAGSTSSGRVFVVSNGDSFTVSLYDSLGAIDFTFCLKSRDLIVSDAASEKVVIFEQNSASYGSRTLITSNDGLVAPSYVSSVESGVILISSRAINRIWSVDPVTGVVIASDVTVTQPFEKLRLRGSFLVSSESGQPGWIYQSTADGPRVTFVPAIQQTNQERKE